MWCGWNDIIRSSILVWFSANTSSNPWSTYTQRTVFALSSYLQSFSEWNAIEDFLRKWADIVTQWSLARARCRESWYNRSARLLNGYNLEPNHRNTRNRVYFQYKMFEYRSKLCTRSMSGYIVNPKNEIRYVLPNCSFCFFYTTTQLTKKMCFQATIYKSHSSWSWHSRAGYKDLSDWISSAIMTSIKIPVISITLLGFLLTNYLALAGATTYAYQRKDSSVLIVGKVFCDTCLEHKLSENGHAISGTISCHYFSSFILF